ncbi:MAG: trypsin-like peptidase domain-containing protein, partial [Bacteroidota bacterium]|nr:trypsin-like peptidase domain-containing protein [Bacteroidota bacterium]
MSATNRKVINLAITITTSLATCLIVLGIAFQLGSPKNTLEENEDITTSNTSSLDVHPDFYQKASFMLPDSLPNFVGAAQNTTECVVHIRSKSTTSYQQSHPFMDDPMFRYIFGDEFSNPQEYESEATGSGVILSESGYIVTNHHVFDGATSVTLTPWDIVEYVATLIGSDPDTDLALLKVEGDNLPAIRVGNSDSVQVGEWVLAVGNPFNLSSTVTAGIVSAKSRNINIGSAQTSVESFIQTDAAVNPGTSGGALVNVDGYLVGINTAIASPTGSYTGYSFAVPSNLMLKVV